MKKRELLQFCGDDIIRAYTPESRKAPEIYAQISDSLDLNIPYCKAIYSRYRKNFLPFVTLMNEMMSYDINSILSGEFSSPYLEVLRVPKNMNYSYQPVAMLIVLRKTAGVPVGKGSVRNIGGWNGVYHGVEDRLTQIEKKAIVFESFPIALVAGKDNNYKLNTAMYSTKTIRQINFNRDIKRINREYNDVTNSYRSIHAQDPSITLLFAFEEGWTRNGVSLDSRYCMDITAERQYEARIMSYRTQGGLSARERKSLFIGGEHAQYQEISKLEYYIIKNLRNKTYDFIRNTKTLG